jgi:hypothetical protein
MRILVETSVLIGASIFWQCDGQSVKGFSFDKCNELLFFLKEHPELGIITKTIEDEARSVLDKAVLKTIHQTYFTDIKEKIRAMTMQHVVSNYCLDRLDKFVEECSSRLPVDTKERDRIKTQEIEPFLNDLVMKTVRYIQPDIPSFIKSKEIREELTDVIVKSLPSKGIVYKGMPADRDLTIMAEATFICRKRKNEEKIYVASIDNHFIPNKVQVGSYLSGYKKYLENELDSTVRDRLAAKFGFIGDEPVKILEVAKQETSEQTT